MCTKWEIEWNDELTRATKFYIDSTQPRAHTYTHTHTRLVHTQTHTHMYAHWPKINFQQGAKCLLTENRFRAFALFDKHKLQAEISIEFYINSVILYNNWLSRAVTIIRHTYTQFAWSTDGNTPPTHTKLSLKYSERTRLAQRHCHVGVGLISSRRKTNSQNTRKSLCPKQIIKEFCLHFFFFFFSVSFSYSQFVHAFFRRLFSQFQLYDVAEIRYYDAWMVIQVGWGRYYFYLFVAPFISSSLRLYHFHSLVPQSYSLLSGSYQLQIEVNRNEKKCGEKK